jgi:hypothetical protein
VDRGLGHGSACMNFTTDRYLFASETANAIGRSGVDLVRPLSWVIDRRVYILILAAPPTWSPYFTRTFDVDSRRRTAALHERIIAKHVTKYNVARPVSSVPNAPGSYWCRAKSQRMPRCRFAALVPRPAWRSCGPCVLRTPRLLLYGSSGRYTRIQRERCRCVAGVVRSSGCQWLSSSIGR